MPGLKDQYSTTNITYSCITQTKIKKSVQQKKELQNKFF